MKQNIFGFLKYFGSPYNLKNRPGALQILMFILIAAFSCLAAWDHISHNMAGTVFWYVQLIILTMAIAEMALVVFFSARNLRPKHPLHAIVEEIVQSEDKTNHGAWCYLGIGVTLLSIACLIITEGQNPSLRTIFYLVKEPSMLVHLTQMLVPLHEIELRVSEIRTRLRACSHDTDSDPSKGALELIFTERRLEGAFNRLFKEYGKDYICILYVSTGSIAVSLCGTLLFFARSSSHKVHIYVFLRYCTSMISAMFKIWSVAHAAQLVRSQMEKFYSELYSACLEDKSRKLAENDLLSVFLERALSDVSFTANGFFPLDHSLFGRMLSAAVAWVFIIVQFRLRDVCPGQSFFDFRSSN